MTHNTPKICRVSDVTEKFLVFSLTPEQLAKIPPEKKIVFRHATQHYKEKGYRQYLARAQYTSSVQSKHKGRIVTVASKLLGIVWDDDPEWIYETDKTKSNLSARRIAAMAERSEMESRRRSDDEKRREEALAKESDCCRKAREDERTWLVSQLLRKVSDPVKAADLLGLELDEVRQIAAGRAHRR